MNDQLIIDYRPFAYKMARRFSTHCPHLLDDLTSEALLGLVQAGRTYDPDRGAKFATHAKRRIVGRFTDFFRKFYNDQNNFVARLEDLGIEDQENALARRERDARFVDIESFDNIIRHIPERHRQVCRLVYIEDMTNKRAAKIMNLSESRVSVLRLEAKEMLKGMFQGACSEIGDHATLRKSR